MGHHLRAVIGNAQPVAQFALGWAHARLVILPQGFALIPVTGELREELIEAFAEDLASPHGELVRLSTALERAVCDASHGARLAYIETDYFGGRGTQGAIGWENGEVACGPLSSSPNVWPINTALAWMGAAAHTESDEFDALHLGNYRDTDTVAEREGKPVRG
jgi:hypothetical protein